jgi:hypothetical protein
MAKLIHVLLLSLLLIGFVARVPQVDAILPAACRVANTVSFCISSSSYQQCTPTVKQISCSIDSYCVNYVDSHGKSNAYCKRIA